MDSKGVVDTIVNKIKSIFAWGLVEIGILAKSDAVRLYLLKRVLLVANERFQLSRGTIAGSSTLTSALELLNDKTADKSVSEAVAITALENKGVIPLGSAGTVEELISAYKLQRRLRNATRV